MAILKVTKREGKGKYESFDLRKSGFIPGVVYGKGMTENIKVSINLKEFLLTLKEGERILDLDISGDVRKVLVKAVQHGTYDHQVLHADFRAIRDDEVIEVDIQVELTGEAEGLKVGGMLEQNLHAITVRCLPKNMPESIVVDVTRLNMGGIIYADSLPKLDGVTYAIHGNPPVVSCHHPAGESEAGTGAEGDVPSAPEVIGEKEREAKKEEKGDKK